MLTSFGSSTSVALFGLCLVAGCSGRVAEEAEPPSAPTKLGVVNVSQTPFLSGAAWLVTVP